jgi:tRNA threonylcarbamoyl adenosine modification protein (Sua5/YciO/YrdC/YwlC family)
VPLWVVRSGKVFFITFADKKKYERSKKRHRKTFILLNHQKLRTFLYWLAYRRLRNRPRTLPHFPTRSMAKILTINPETLQPRLIAQVVDLLRRGGVIGYPTDTMYGIGCDIFNQKAVKRIHQIKRRPRDKPFSFMCDSLTNISQYGHVGNTAYRLMKKNLPGPYTFVLSGTKLVPKIMLTRQKTVGIRVPEHPVCLAIIRELGNPVLNTSATTEDDDTVVRIAADVDRLFGKQIDLIIDSGEILPEPSSVISLLTDPPEILREGKGDISAFL